MFQQGHATSIMAELNSVLFLYGSQVRGLQGSLCRVRVSGCTSVAEGCGLPVVSLRLLETVTLASCVRRVAYVLGKKVGGMLATLGWIWSVCALACWAREVASEESGHLSTVVCDGQTLRTRVCSTPCNSTPRIRFCRLSSVLWRRERSAEKRMEC